MSANRIVRRRAFISSNPTVSYHERCVENGERHEDFQKRIRSAREARGHSAAASCMHTFYGQRY